MWKIQLPTGEYLESVPALQFELNNQVFSNSDASVLPGSFSFPVDLDLTPANRRLLDFPDLVTNSRNWKTYAGCWVYADGVPLFFGTLTIRQATARKLSITVVANPLSALKSVPLNTLDLGGDHTFADASAVLSHAKDTTTAPLDYDYVFFPVFNDIFLNAPTTDDRCLMQNHYSPTAAEFQVAEDYPALMPFARLEYVLERIFAGQDFAFRNRWQITDDLRKLCLYNNRSLWTAGALSTVINLKNHLSTTKSTDMLKSVAALFNLGLFTNVFQRTISLVPLRDLVNRPPAHDWTPYAILDPVLEGTENQPDIFQYKDYDETQAYSTRMGLPAAADVLATFDTITDLLDDPVFGFTDGIYYITGREAYYALNTAFSYPENIRRWYDELTPAPLREGKRPFEIPLVPMHDFWYASDALASPPASAPQGAMPFCRIPGIVDYTPTGDDAPTTQTGDIPDRLMAYRGIVEDPAFHNYPAACCTTYDYQGNDIGQYSLRLGGERGIYATWWRAWHQMLISGKHLTQTFTLPVTELVKFSFEDKVRVVNMDYFVKRLRVQKLIGRGLALVEVSMVSVV